MAKRKRPVDQQTTNPDTTELEKATNILQESEQRYRIASELTATFVFSLSVAKDGNVTLDFLSESFYAFAGRGKENARSLESVFSHLHPDDKSKVLESLKKLLANARSIEIECRAYVRNPQELKWISVCGKSEWDEKQGRVKSIFGAVKDITDRKLAEEALRESEERYRGLINLSSEIIVVIQEDMIKLVNSKGVELLGYSELELLSKPFLELVHPDDRQSVATNHDRRLKGQPLPRRYEFRVLAKDGTTIWFELSANLINWQNTTATLASLMDITERKRAEEELKLNESKYRTLVEMSQDLIAIYQKGKIVFINEAGIKLVGASSADLIVGKSVTEFAPANQKNTAEQRMARVLQEGTSPLYVQTLRRLDGSELDIEVMGTTFTYRGEIAVQLVARDITERKRAEAALRESEFRLARAEKVASIGNWKIIVNKGEIVASVGAGNIYGVDSNNISLHDVQTIPLPEYRNILDKALRDLIERNIPYDLEFRIRKPNDATIRYIHSLADYDKNNNTVYGVIQDITEQKLAEEELRNSEERFKTLFQRHSAINFVLDPETGSILDANEAAADFYGWSISQLTRMNIQQINVLPAEVVKNDLKKAALSKKMRFEFSHRLADGSIREVEVFTKRIDIQGKSVLYSVIHDITERKQAEEALKESEEKYRILFNNEIYGICIFDPDTLKLIDANETMGRLSGYSREELLSVITIPDLTAELDKSIPTIDQTKSEYNATRIPLRYIRKKDGSVFPVEAVAYTYVWQGRQVIYSILRDITERYQAEQVVHESEEKYRLLFDNELYAVDVYDMETLEILDANQAHIRLYGYSRSELLSGMTILDFTNEKSETRAEVDEIIRTGSLHIPLRYHRKKDGTVFAAEIASASYRWKERKVGIGIIHDITERTRAVEALKESEEKFRSIIEQSADGIVVTNEAGAVAEWNEAQQRITGLRRSDVLGLPAWEAERLIMPKDEQTSERVGQIKARVQGLLRGDGGWIPSREIEHPIVLPDGSIKTVSEHLFVIKRGSENMIVSIVSDITQKIKTENDKRLVEQYLQQAQKLESLGILAGGIAHDFNNLLMGIFGFTDIARRKVEDEAISEYLTRAMESMERAKGLTQQLLTFAKGGAPVKRITPIASLIRETCQFASHGSNVRANLSLREDLWQCNVDKNQIGQVIQNLIINAIQAMPMGGEVQVTAENLRLAEEDVATLKKGDYVLVSVKDQGIGISEEMLSRIFDPFFTTKTQGHGLGLAISHSIITRHGGAIVVQSELGKGTTFDVYLPAIGEAGIENLKPTVIGHSGTGKILLMDDEEALRSLMSYMLESFGYSVIGKSNAKDTLDFFVQAKENGEDFAAVILDLTVPGGKGGKEVAQEIRKIDEEIPLFVSTGYAGDPILANPEEYGFTAGISKPFKMADLMEMLGKHIKKTK